MLYVECLQKILKELAGAPDLKNNFVGAFLPPGTKAPALILSLEDLEDEDIYSSRCWGLLLTFWIEEYSLIGLKEQEEATLKALKNFASLKVTQRTPPTVHPEGGLTQTLQIQFFKGSSYA